jgi:hypothetical protein
MLDEPEVDRADPPVAEQTELPDLKAAVHVLTSAPLPESRQPWAVVVVHPSLRPRIRALVQELPVGWRYVNRPGGEVSADVELDLLSTATDPHLID